VGGASRKLEPLLDAGVRLYVADGPVTEDGYAWYQVQPYGEAQALPFGWVAGSGRDGEPWIESFGLGCDAAAPTAETLAGGEPLEHLYCSLAGETPRSSPPGPDIEVEGDVYCTLADDHWGPLSGPAWIEQIGYCELRTDVGSLRVPGTPLTRSLGGPTNPVEGRYHIVGHVDDPGARECRMGSYDEADLVEPAQAVLHCRTYFVVTAATPLPS
jgi:hypothetical protein